MNRLFEQEKLEVDQESLAFVAWLEPLLQKLPKAVAVPDELAQASTSSAPNLVEGNGKFTSPDDGRPALRDDIWRGSVPPGRDAAALDVLAPPRRGRCELSVVACGKERRGGIVSRRVGLIKANSDWRLQDGD